MYEVRLARGAARYYQRVDADTARRLAQCFDSLRQNPFAGDVRPLKGRRGLYRYRVGELRVVFSVDRSSLIVMVIAIGPRGDIY
jgi:mRNA interferase RelE/StbE